ncbi:MAG: acetylglutamate kinase [Ginsengibacter sp.]
MNDVSNSNSEVLHSLKNDLCVVKIGGNIIDNEKLLLSFLQKFTGIPGHKILVHGGGKIATSIGEKLNIESKYKDGRRITNDETIDLVTMVYGGLVNKKIVAILQSMGSNAIGLSGADGNVMPAVKRPVKDIDYGWVGDITADSIDPTAWDIFLTNDLVPVLAPLTHDGSGHLLNTNADTMAAVIAAGLSSIYSVKLIYCFEKNGVLDRVDDDDSVIRELDSTTYHSLKNENKLHSGILPKIDNAFYAVERGVPAVVIGNSSDLAELIVGSRGTKMLK